NGLYYFVSFYPTRQAGKELYINAGVFAAIVLATIFTNFITNDAALVDDEIVYNDGPGFMLFTAYMAVVCLSALYRLIQSWRKYPEHRSRVQYFFIGIAVFVICAIVFNMVLPSFGNYDFLIVGRLAVTFTPL